METFKSKMLKALDNSNLPFDDWNQINKIDLILLIIDVFTKDMEEKQVNMKSN